jgi:hypothetical protein
VADTQSQQREVSEGVSHAMEGLTSKYYFFPVKGVHPDDIALVGYHLSTTMLQHNHMTLLQTCALSVVLDLDDTVLKTTTQDELRGCREEVHRKLHKLHRQANCKPRVEVAGQTAALQEEVNRIWHDERLLEAFKTSRGNLEDFICECH